MTITTSTINISAPVINPEVQNEAEVSFEANYLDLNLINFHYEGENLTLTLADGTYYPRVTLRRCFPFSTNGMYITVRTPDTEKGWHYRWDREAQPRIT